VYEYDPASNINKKRLLIGVHDIYGLAYPNLKQVTDELGAQNGGFISVLPDFFRGEYVDLDWSAEERQEWSDRVTDWGTIVKPDLINIVQYYRSKGVEEFGIYGMCYGGRISALASIEISEYFKASALVHPSGVTDGQAEFVQIPMYLMPASNDPDMSEFYRVLQSKFGDNCGHRRFDDVTHGFTGGRSNYSDPLIRERVDEVIEKLGVFFDRNLNETKVSSNSSKLQPYVIGITTIIAFVLLIGNKS